jgi:hypothetical protein
MQLKLKETIKNYQNALQYWIDNPKEQTVHICQKFKIDQGYFSKYMKSKGFNMRRKPLINDSIFEIIDTEEKAYWLGFLYADGNVYIRNEKNRMVNRLELSLAEKDVEHLKKYIKFLNGDISMLKYRSNVKAYRVSFGSKKVCEDLIKLGCIPNKSLTLKFPNESQVPKTLIRHFIRGYFDGDGCISHLKNNQNSFSISLLGTFEFLTSILSEYKLSKTLIRKDKRIITNTFILNFKRTEGLEFLYKLYNNSNIFLDRKKEKFFNILYSCRPGKKLLGELGGNIGELCDENTEIS